MGRIEIDNKGDNVLENLYEIKTKMQMIEMPQDEQAKHYYVQIMDTADTALENTKFYIDYYRGKHRARDYKELFHEFSNVYGTIKGFIFLLKIKSDEKDAKILTDLEKEINQLIELIASTDLEE